MLPVCANGNLTAVAKASASRLASNRLKSASIPVVPESVPSNTCMRPGERTDGVRGAGVFELLASGQRALGLQRIDMLKGVTQGRVVLALGEAIERNVVSTEQSQGL